MMEGTLKAATAEERNINKAAFLHVLSRFVGSEVKVIAVEHTMGGVFYTATPHTHNNFLVVIKGDGNDLVKGSTTFLQGNEWISVESKKLDLSPKMELQTDSAIRGKDISHLSGRDLVSASDWVIESPLANLESAGGVGTWNQFDANAKLKDYKRTQFDENLYTKRLDLSSMSAAQIKRAEQMALEIESQVSSNIHMQEERGHALERDIDEEALYSGVIGTGGYAQGAPKGFSSPSNDEAEAASWRRNQRPGTGPGPAQGQGQGQGQGKNKGPSLNPQAGGGGSPRGPGPPSASAASAASAAGAAPVRAVAAPPRNAWGGDGLPAGVLGQPQPEAGPGAAAAPPPGLSPVPSPQTSPRAASAAPVPAPRASAPAPAPAPAAGGAAAEAPPPAAAAAAAAAAGEAKKQLSATAKEWKPNAAAASFVPKAALVPVPQSVAGPGGGLAPMGPGMLAPPPQVMMGGGSPMGMRPPFIAGPGYPPQYAGMQPPAGAFAYDGSDLGPPLAFYPQPPMNMVGAGPMMGGPPMPAGPYGGGYPAPYMDQRGGGYPDEQYGMGNGGPYGPPHGGRGGYNDYDRARQGRGGGGGGYGGGVGGGGGGGTKMRGRGGSRDNYDNRPDYDDAYSRNNEMMRQGRERGASFQEDQGGDGAYHHQQQHHHQHHQQGIPHPQMAQRPE